MNKREVGVDAVAGTRSRAAHAQANGIAARLARGVFFAIAWLFVAGVVVQVFLAGLGVFVGAANFATHTDVGYALQGVTLLLTVSAIAARAPRGTVGLTAALIGLLMLQSIFIAFRGAVPALAALHPPNALAIFGVALVVARRAAAVVGWRRGSSKLDPAPDVPRPARKQAGT